MPRMKILNSIEQEAFELPPLLNSAERKRHFDFPVAILQIAAELRTAANQLCFLLSCGYFASILSMPTTPSNTSARNKASASTRAKSK